MRRLARSVGGWTAAKGHMDDDGVVGRKGKIRCVRGEQEVETRLWFGKKFTAAKPDI